MGSATSFTADRMLQIENTTIIGGAVDSNGDLILETREGQFINAGHVVGPPSPNLDDASTTTKGIVRLSTDIETIAGTDPNIAVTPNSLDAKRASTSEFGISRFATNEESREFIEPNAAISPVGLGSMRSYNSDWERVIPGSAFNALTAAPIPFDPVTGIITVPLGTAQLSTANVFQPNYEYMLRNFIIVSGAHATDHSLWVRMTQGGIVSPSGGYQTAGWWAQYSGIWGVYSVNSGTGCAIGPVSGSAEHTSTVILTPMLATTGYFVNHTSMTSGSARGSGASGYTRATTSGFWDGFNYFLGAGTFSGEVHIFRRKLR